MKTFYIKLAAVAVIILMISGGVTFSISKQHAKDTDKSMTHEAAAMKALEAAAMKQEAAAKAASQTPATHDAMEHTATSPATTDTMQHGDAMMADK